ncbi:hypothetical protein [Phocaeicola sp.]
MIKLYPSNRRGRLNLPDNIQKVYLCMHYSQGRDRWFGRIQSAPTVDVTMRITNLPKRKLPPTVGAGFACPYA